MKVQSLSMARAEVEKGEGARGEAANIPNAQFGFIVLIKYKGSSS